MRRIAPSGRGGFAFLYVERGVFDHEDSPEPSTDVGATQRLPYRARSRQNIVRATGNGRGTRWGSFVMVSEATFDQEMPKELTASKSYSLFDVSDTVSSS